MWTKKEVANLAYPLFAIVIGAVFIFSRDGGELGYPIEAERPIAVSVGAFLCLLGVWGIVRVLKEN